MIYYDHLNHHRTCKQQDSMKGSYLGISYTDEEDAMIRQAEKAFGSQARAKDLTTRGSNEPDYVVKVSPIKGFKGYKRK